MKKFLGLEKKICMSKKVRFEEELASDGRIYYYNPKTGESTWTNPANADKPKSYFWKKCKDQNGYIFYYNSRTKESSWTRPPDYDIKIERQQEAQFRRQNFFKMMSSSVQKDLNPIEYNSPSIFTIKEASARFDTDPRLINVTEKQRERFFDEWLTLERKRRVELEKKMVIRAKERLKEKMIENVEAKSFTIDTKWEDIIGKFRYNTDWRILLNYDRLQVFIEVKKKLHDDYVLSFNERREQQTTEETKRRVDFLDAIRRFIDKKTSSVPITDITFELFSEEIKELPEYIEMKKNVNGSTAADLFYDVVEEKMSHLDQKVEQMHITEEDFDFEKFCEKYKEEYLQDLNENEIRYIYESAIRDFLIYRDYISAEAQAKEDAFMKALKLNSSLVTCTSFEEAKLLLKSTREMNDIESEEEQKRIFDKFVEWGKNRNCEPGEILPGDDDWVDIGPMVENEIRKRQLDQLK